jgi:hypothetical protein
MLKLLNDFPINKVCNKKIELLKIYFF